MGKTTEPDCTSEAVQQTIRNMSDLLFLQEKLDIISGNH
jgi:hypothetical protein